MVGVVGTGTIAGSGATGCLRGVTGVSGAIASGTGLGIGASSALGSGLACGWGVKATGDRASGAVTNGKILGI